MTELIGVNVTQILETIVTTELDVVYVDFTLKYYVPIFDPLGPFMIYPEHCYPERARRSQLHQYRAPLIGYIPTGSQVEADLVSQLDSLFRLQRTVVQGSSTLTVLGALSSVVDLSGVVIEDELLRFSGNADEFGINATDTSVIDKGLFGSRSSTIGLLSEIGDFRLQEFESKEALEEYLGDAGLGREEGKDAVCFAFQITENDNKYELELFFNDKKPGWSNAIPDQTTPSYASS